MTNPSRQQFVRVRRLTGGLRQASCLVLFAWMSHSGIAAPPTVVAVREIGRQFQPNPLNITGQDCAASLPLSADTSLWLFGDTIVGPFESIRNLPLGGFLSSTAAVVPRQDVSQGVRQFRFLTETDGNRARQVVRFTADEDPAQIRLWPVHGIVVGEHVYLYYHKIRLLPNVDVFENFRLEGMGVARAAVTDLNFERLRAPDGGLEFWKADAPGFGVFVSSAPDGYVYLWGSAYTAMFLARCRPESLSDGSAYEYLVAAPTLTDPQRPVMWAKEFRATAPLFDNVPNEMSAHFNQHLGQYLAVHTWGRENRLVLRVAPRIEGPWSDAETFFQPERTAADDYFYAAKEHPELATDNGRTLYVTFVNSAQYVPRLVEVRLREQR